MMQADVPVDSVREVAPNIHVLALRAPEIAAVVRPGQFLNIRSPEHLLPLLRRPFSVYRVDGPRVEIIFNVVGAGTRILAHTRPGSPIDVLGPLGNSFGVHDGDGEAWLVAGGLGVAPMPILTAELRRAGRTIRTFLGARTAAQIVPQHLDNVEAATDDGSRGRRGTVVDLLRALLPGAAARRPTLFACGPTPMLRALSEFCAESGLRCELSLESPMACGIGICQGCPVETTTGPRKYALVCREGTVFDSSSVVL